MPGVGGFFIITSSAAGHIASIWVHFY